MNKLGWAALLAVAAVGCLLGSFFAPTTAGPGSPSRVLALAGIAFLVAAAYVASAYNRERGGWELGRGQLPPVRGKR